MATTIGGVTGYLATAAASAVDGTKSQPFPIPQLGRVIYIVSCEALAVLAIAYNTITLAAKIVPATVKWFVSGLPLTLAQDAANAIPDGLSWKSIRDNQLTGFKNVLTYQGEILGGNATGRNLQKTVGAFFGQTVVKLSVKQRLMMGAIMGIKCYVASAAITYLAYSVGLLAFSPFTLARELGQMLNNTANQYGISPVLLKITTMASAVVVGSVVSLIRRGIAQELILKRGVAAVVRKVAPDKEKLLSTTTAKVCRVALMSRYFAYNLLSGSESPNNWMHLSSDVAEGTVKESKSGLAGSVAFSVTDTLLKTVWVFI